jgi:hypothetical protein
MRTPPATTARPRPCAAVRGRRPHIIVTGAVSVQATAIGTRPAEPTFNGGYNNYSYSGSNFTGSVPAPAAYAEGTVTLFADRDIRLTSVNVSATAETPSNKTAIGAAVAEAFAGHRGQQRHRDRFHSVNATARGGDDLI